MSIFSSLTWTVPSGARAHGGRLSAVNVPTGKMIVLGEAPLMGALTGLLAIEVCSESKKNQQVRARIWTLYDSTGQDFINRIRHSLTKPFRATALNGSNPSTLLPYSRICADAPLSAQPVEHLQFWVDPQDALTHTAGLGSQWLEPLSCAPCDGLILTQLNHHMLSSDSMHELQVAGLLLDYSSLEDYWSDETPAQVFS